MKHFLNICPKCGDVSKCRCSHCHRVLTYKLCPRCAEESTTTAGYDISMAPPGRIGMHDVSYEKWKPLPHDMIQFYLPFLMRKLGFSYIAAELETKMQIIKELKKKGYISLAKQIEKKIKAGGWNTFLDPLTKRHIIKTGRLPGKKHKEESSYTSSASNDHV